jgi:hypothetical protein
LFILIFYGNTCTYNCHIIKLPLILSLHILSLMGSKPNMHCAAQPVIRNPVPCCRFEVFDPLYKSV